jgi:hypothetical protein
MWKFKSLASRAGFITALLTGSAAQAAVGDAQFVPVPAAERLTLVGVFGHASPLMKVVLWGLLASAAAAALLWLLQLVRISQGRANGIAGGVAYLSAQAAAAPLFGLFGMAYALLDGFIGIANVRPTPNLTVLAPGLAEATLSLGLGLLAAAIAIVGHRHLKTTLFALDQAEPSAARSAPPSPHPARAIA